MLTLLAKILAALNSENSPRQISLAIALGMVVGLTPLLSMHNVLLLLLAFLLRINLSAFFLSVGGFTGLGLMGANLFAGVGETLLNAQSLYTWWGYLYQATWFKLAHLHHTLTLGALVVALLLFLPLMLASQWLIIRYRALLSAWVEKFHIIRSLKASRFYKIYLSMTDVGA